jgi:hypothetical protein
MNCRQKFGELKKQIQMESIDVEALIDQYSQEASTHLFKILESESLFNSSTFTVGT